MLNKDFYYKFEEKYRGSRNLIKERLKVYLPFVLKCKETHGVCSALDIGCGRGEWLELMTDNSVDAKGIDLDEGMLAPCRELGLNVELADALETLRSMPDSSLSIVTGFHIAEHLPFDILVQVVHEAKRVLKPAGLLILETPNPEDLCVGACNFYTDSTHIRPLPPTLLSFLPEYEGYCRVKILRLQEDKSLRGIKDISLFHAITGASPDYSIVAQKEDEIERLKSFDSLFGNEYGLTMHELCESYDKMARSRIAEQETCIVQQETRIVQQETRIVQQETRIVQQETRIAQQETRIVQQETRIAQQETRIAQQETRIAQQDAALAARAQEIRALQKKLDDTYNLLVNTRHRTLYGALAWLWHKVFKRR